MTRYIKRGGRVWITIFDRPPTKHPGFPYGFGGRSRVLDVMCILDVLCLKSPVSRKMSHEALRRAIDKLPMKCRIIAREGGNNNGYRYPDYSIKNLNEKTDAEIETTSRSPREELFNLRFQKATSQLGEQFSHQGR